MLPISDKNPRRTIPWFTYFLILLNFAIFFLELTHDESFIIKWSLVASRFFQNPLAGFPTLFTSMFMHAGWLHIIGNMLYLWIFGDNVEDRFGHFRFIVFYLICGILAMFVQMAFNSNSNVPTLGASGAIAGVLGAYIIMFPRARVSVLMGFFIIPLPALLVIGVWIVLQFFFSVGSIGADVGVAYIAHVGGFVSGMILTLFFRFGSRRQI
ncbi:MAG: rhomboid family intramembrane serine protease [Chloroflexota bacterium]